MKSALSILMLLLAVVALADERRPIPTAAEQRRTKERVQELFGDELRSARTNAERDTFAQRLLKIAIDSVGKPIERYVLLDMAAAMGAGQTKLNANALLAREYTEKRSDVEINVLPLVDLEKGATGAWSAMQQGVRFDGGQSGTLELPLTVEGEYDLSFTFTRHAGVYRIATDFPAGRRQCALHLSAHNGKAHGIGPIRGREPVDSVTATAGGRVTNGELHRVDLLVRFPDEESVHVMVGYDGKKIIDWAGPATDIGDEGAANFSVAIPGKCKVTLHAMRLTAHY